MHSFQFHYDTQFTKGLLWIRIKADDITQAKSEFWKWVPGCTELRRIFQEY